MGVLDDGLPKVGEFWTTRSNLDVTVKIMTRTHALSAGVMTTFFGLDYGRMSDGEFLSDGAHVNFVRQGVVMEEFKKHEPDRFKVGDVLYSDDGNTFIVGRVRVWRIQGSRVLSCRYANIDETLNSVIESYEEDYGTLKHVQSALSNFNIAQMNL